MSLNRDASAVESVVIDILEFLHHYGFSSAFLRETEKLYQEHVVAPAAAAAEGAEKETVTPSPVAPVVGPGTSLVTPEQPSTPAVPPSPTIPGEVQGETLQGASTPANVAETSTNVQAELDAARARVAELEAQQAQKSGTAIETPGSTEVPDTPLP